MSIVRSAAFVTGTAPARADTRAWDDGQNSGAATSVHVLAAATVRLRAVASTRQRHPLHARDRSRVLTSVSKRRAALAHWTISNRRGPVPSRARVLQGPSVFAQPIRARTCARSRLSAVAPACAGPSELWDAEPWDAGPWAATGQRALRRLDSLPRAGTPQVWGRGRRSEVLARRQLMRLEHFDARLSGVVGKSHSTG